MAEVLVQETNLQAIADAIRAKNGTETTYKPSEMGTAIRAIESGGGSVEIKEASGSFTLIENVVSYNIDISELGWIPDLVFIQLDETNLTYTTTPTKGWVLIDFPLLNDIGLAKYAVDSNYIGKTNLAYTYRGAQGVNNLQVGASTINKVGLYIGGSDERKAMLISRSAASYPIIAGTYNWYAYKIWEDE